MVKKQSHATTDGGGHSPTTTSRKTAIVVGAGPAGLAAAIMLSRPPHNYDVTILESSKSKEEFLGSAQNDPTKAYYYNINGRGQTFTKLYPKLQHDLENLGVGVTKFGFYKVPGNPKERFDENAKFITRSLSKEKQQQIGIMYWIPRHLFIKLLHDYAIDVNENGEAGSGTVQIVYNTKCQHVIPKPTPPPNSPSYSSSRKRRKMIMVIAISETKQTEDDDFGIVTTSTYEASLVIGADGVNSAVRESLATTDYDYNEDNTDGEGSITSVDSSTLPPFHAWKNYDPKSFHVVKFSSPSVGLRVKTLQLKPNIEIPIGGGGQSGTIKPKFDANYLIESVNTGMTNNIKFTLFPTRDVEQPRPVVMATLPNHDLWKISTGDEMKEFFKNAFPRFSFDDTSNSIVEENEWDRFAKSQGVTFPHCQYSNGVSIWYNDKDTSVVGIALVGDAIHASPPDLGQGVNVALHDIVVLGRCLRNDGSSSRGGGNDESHPLCQYQRIQEPEAKALIRLARIGAPYQYRQSSPKMILGRYLWTFNVMLRVVLNKVSCGVIAEPAIVLMMNPNVKFVTIMKQADRVTYLLWAMIVLVMMIPLYFVTMTGNDGSSSTIGGTSTPPDL